MWLAPGWSDVFWPHPEVGRPSGPLDRSCPHPYLVLMGWCAESDQNGPLSPGDRLDHMVTVHVPA
jgi:hypothetical protein